MRGTLRNYIGRCLTSRCREANSTARVREPPNKGRLTTCHFQSVAARQQGSELGLTALILEYVLDVNGLACRVFPGSGYGKLPRITADKTLSHRYSVSFGTRIGIPATAGLLAKYYVFNSALSVTVHPTALVWLTVIGLINSAVASYYYLRLIVVMYMREPVVAEAPAPASAATRLALVLAACATIYLGVMPGKVLDLAARGAMNLSGYTARLVIRVQPPQSSRTTEGSAVPTPVDPYSTPAK